MGRLKKTVIYQAIGLMLAFTTSYIVFGTISGSMRLIILDLAVFTSFYYIYETIWEKVSAYNKRKHTTEPRP